MPVINNYSKDGKLISSTKEPLAEHNIERFINEDMEKAKIYLEALAEFTAAVKEMAFNTLPSGDTAAKSPHMARKLITNFYHHNSNVLELSKKLIDNKANEKPGIS